MSLAEKLAARRAKTDAGEDSAPSSPASTTTAASSSATSPPVASRPAIAPRPVPMSRPAPATPPSAASTASPTAAVAKPQPERPTVKSTATAGRLPDSQEPPTKRSAPFPAVTSPVAVSKKLESLAPAAKMDVVAPLQARKKSVAMIVPPSGPTPEEEALDWLTHHTADGEAYYVNRKTNKTTWDKPDCLLAEGESAELQGEWVWVQHEELAWIPAKIISKLSDGGLEVTEQHEGSSGDARRVKAKEVGPRILSAKTLNSLTSDLVQLDESTPLFTTQIMHEYADNTKTAMDKPPHPYSVINGSLTDLIEFGQDQSLLISGESGAGKTVTVKVCLEFISEIAGSTDNVEEQILASNPLLEAFGNAKTKRNDNSSRFGKFMEVHLSKQSGYKIVGCSVVHYLLEKSRVVAQAEGERNFHSFYYVVNQTTPEEKDQLFIKNRSPESFKFLSKDGSTCAPAEQHDDQEECQAMRHSFKDMNVSNARMLDCFKLVAAVLHLGDLEFKEFESSGSQVGNKDALEKAAKLFGVPAVTLEKVLTKHESMQRDGLLTRAFPPSVALDARNALARHAYGRLFDYLIKMVNQAMAADRIKSTQTQFIGMLDIFGFEIFEINSFEQLCINFANEKLQQLFNRHTFTLEERTYQDEGIQFDHITFHDSQPLLTFLGLSDSKDTILRDGVFQILDEQTAVGSGTDEKFLQTVGQKHKDKKALFTDLCKIRSRFKVYHYAGAVEYESTGFVAKNADKLYENILTCMRESTSELISKELFASDHAGGDDVGGSSKTKTQASLFMKQLQALEQRTSSTFPRYVRCVKPNSAKKPRVFDSVLSLQQLRFAGVFEAVSIRKLGFPFRHTHQHFFEYFKCLSTYEHDKWMQARRVVQEQGISNSKTAFTSLAKRLWQDLVDGPVPESKDCRFGKTMVLFRAKEHRSLEIARLAALNKACAMIQKVAKGRYVRRHTPELRVAKAKLELAIRSRDEDKLDVEIAAASVLFFKIKAAYDADAVKASVRQEKRMRPKLENLLKLDCDQEPVYESFFQAVKEMDSYIEKDPLAFQSMEEAHEVRKVYDLCTERRTTKRTLAQALEDIPVTRCGDSIAKLQQHTDIAQDLGKRGQNSGGTRYYAAELENALSNLKLLTQELEICRKASQISQASCMLGDVKHVQPGDMDYSTCQKQIAQMRTDVDRIRVHGPQSPDVIEAMVAMEVILDLRESALLALALGEGAAADEPEWKRVEAVLRDVRGLETHFGSDLFPINNSEVDMIANDLSLRAAVDDVVVKLTTAIQAVDDEQLTVAIGQAMVLKMFEHPDQAIQNVCYDANELLPKVQDARKQLADALREVQETLLCNALVAQATIGFGVAPGMLGYDTVQKARQLYVWVVELTAETRLASQVMYTEPCKAVVEGCDEIRLKLPELDPIRRLLALNKQDRLYSQSEYAVKCKNYRRAVRLRIESKDCVLDMADRDKMSLANFPGMKTAEDFSRRFGIHWKTYKDSMLTWYNPLFGKIHQSLTHIEGGSEEESKAWNRKAPYLFRNLFAVMGDRKATEVDALAFEILDEGVNTPQLRDEIYCQLMKQLSNNPSTESEFRGWNMMAMCCAAFPPSEGLKDYLEYYLKQASRTECVWKLHMTYLGGQLSIAPNVDTITRLRAGAANGDTSFWMPGHRREIAFDESQFANMEKVEQVVLDWRAVRYTPGVEFANRRAEMKRNSLGVDVFVGGEAPKLGANGASSMPAGFGSSGGGEGAPAKPSKPLSTPVSPAAPLPSGGGVRAPPQKPTPPAKPAPRPKSNGDDDQLL
ncbi:hypothetical protein BASA81_002293 [Batrachochytrium salamandrivorans]|nr:hypothetical protein BASA81_002293 [Batrachochytrium salamandrivorans]